MRGAVLGRRMNRRTFDVRTAPAPGAGHLSNEKYVAVVAVLI